MKSRFSGLWAWFETLSAIHYLLSGIALFCIKYNIDRVIMIVRSGGAWWGFCSQFLLPLEIFKFHYPKDMVYALSLLLAAIVFTVLGLGLVAGRLKATRLPRWLALFFLISPVNFFFFFLLGVIPDDKDVPSTAVDNATFPQPDDLDTESLNKTVTPANTNSVINRYFPIGAIASAVLGSVITGIIGAILALISTGVFRIYGNALFVGVPFCLGILPVLVYGAREKRDLMSCLGVATLATTFTGIFVLLAALEGVICLLMASPIAYICAWIGAIIGYFIQLKGFEGRQLWFSCWVIVLVMPFLMGFEANSHIQPTVHQVKSSVIINATPQTIWNQVVAFTEISLPKEEMFRFGIAYPIRARIYGHGVGAVRHCIFSTGPFVEPITVWNEPHLLKFDVLSQPPIMKEFSPYPNLQPQHVNDYLVSQGGQFRLIPLSNGRTKLEGTTWYTHKIWPEEYWHIWSDLIMHQIHLRVLNHIKHEVEG